MNRDPLNHDELVDLLPLWIGGDLDEETADRVALAVADSDELSERAEALAASRRVFVDGLATALVDDPAPDLWPGVRAGLVAEGVLSAEVAPGDGRLLQFPWRRVAAAAAVLVSASVLLRVFVGGGTIEPLESGPQPSITPAVASFDAGMPTAVPVVEVSEQVDSLGGLVPLGDKSSQRDSMQLMHFEGRPFMGSAGGTGTQLVSDVR